MGKQIKNERRQSIFKVEDFFMLRTPLYPVEKYKDIFCNDITKEQSIEKIYDTIKNDPAIREAIMVSTLSLYKELDNIGQETNVRKKEQVISSIVKYLIRLTTRTTPYGLFSGVARGTFANNTNIKLSDNLKNAKRTRVDMEWLYAVIRSIEKDKEILNNIYILCNDLVTINGTRLEIPYISNYGQIQKEDKLDNITASIRNTEQVQKVMELTKTPIKYKKLIKILKHNNPNVNKERIELFINQLMDNEYLITELRPPLTNTNPFNYVLSKLKNINEAKELYNSLVEIDSLIDEYDKKRIGSGEKKYLNIINKMKTIKKCKNYLQVDMGLNTEKVLLDQNIAKEIEKISNLMLKLSQEKNTYPYMEEYLNDFIELYGEDREVQLLKVLDEDRGLGYPATFTRPMSKRSAHYTPRDVKTREIQNFFKNKVIETLVDNRDEVVITDEEIASIQTNHLEHEIPSSLEIYSLLSYSKENNDFTIHLGENFGSPLVGKSFGRFIDIMPNEIKEDFNKIEQEQKKLYGEDSIVAEIVELPQSGRLSNISLNWNPRKYELSLSTNNCLSKNKISIKDLYIGVERDNYKAYFYIKSKKLNKKIIIKANNMMNISLCSNIYRFLYEISMMKERSIISSLYYNFEECFGNMDYTPRIKFSKTILYPASWRLNKNLLSLTDNNFIKKNFYNAFDLWKVKWNVPQFVYLVEGDNRLLLNLDNKLHLDELYYILDKNKSDNLRLNEIEGNIDNRIVKGDDGGYFSEIIFPITKNQNLDTIKKKEDSKVSLETKSDYKFNRNNFDFAQIKRTFFPGEEWLSMKLYGNSKRTEEFIGFYLKHFCQELLQLGIIEKFFFLRYADPERHIRLRLKIQKNNMYFNLIEKLTYWFKWLNKVGLLNSVNIDTYKREVERYGGVELIELAEDVFYKDSVFTCNFINYMRNKNVGIPLESFIVVSIINIMEEMGLSYELQKQIFLNNFDKDINRHFFQTHRKELIKICNSNGNWKGLKFVEGGEFLKKLFNLRKISLKQFSKKMFKLDDEYGLWTDKNTILFSIIHMHCNRIIGSREKEAIIMATVRHTLHALEYFKKNNI